MRPSSRRNREEKKKPHLQYLYGAPTQTSKSQLLQCGFSQRKGSRVPLAAVIPHQTPRPPPSFRGDGACSPSQKRRPLVGPALVVLAPRGGKATPSFACWRDRTPVRLPKVGTQSLQSSRYMQPLRVGIGGRRVTMVVSELSVLGPVEEVKKRN